MGASRLPPAVTSNTIGGEDAVVVKGQLATWDAVMEFMLAGNATFTLRSLRTGTRFTYRVRVKKEDADAKTEDPTYFVSLLRGRDNESDYAYVGVLRRDLGLRLTAASRMGRRAPAVVGLVWFLDAARCRREVLGTRLEFWHEGRCGRCGRKLTVPQSILDGFGPECQGLRTR